MDVFIYRVQNNVDGRGPFRHGFISKWMMPTDRRVSYGAINTHSLSQSFGSYWQLRIPSGFHVASGCRTVEQVMTWFAEPEIERLREFGYDLVRIKVDRILEEDDTQVLFARRRHLYTRTMKIKELPTEERVAA